MNRRDILKALGGIPLLGLLAKVPKRKPTLIRPVENWYISEPESEWHMMVYEGDQLISDDDPDDAFEAAYAALRAGAEEQPPYELDLEGDPSLDWLVERYNDENGDWQERVWLGTPPTDLHWDDDPTPGMSYWDGQAWIGM